MNRPTQNLLVKVTLWLLVELVLNLVGLDSLADYSEFLFDKHAIISREKYGIICNS